MKAIVFVCDGWMPSNGNIEPNRVRTEPYFNHIIITNDPNSLTYDGCSNLNKIGQKFNPKSQKGARPENNNILELT